MARPDFFLVYSVLRQMFDRPTPDYADFDVWRREQYELLLQGRIRNLPLKTWWPKYGLGDFRLELCLGALLVPQVPWPTVRVCLENIIGFLDEGNLGFDVNGLLSIPQASLEELVKPARFRKKAEWILRFCRFVKEHSGTLPRFFEGHDPATLGTLLSSLKAGFGSETRDAVLLYAANAPVFVADAYAREVLRVLGVSQGDDYAAAQRIFEEGLRRDFDAALLQEVVEDYGPVELDYALCNSPNGDVPRVLLYQQFHAGIDELGISKRWEEFRALCHDAR